MLAKVYVSPKSSILDPQGKAITQSLHSLNYKEVLGVRMGKYLEIELADIPKAQALTRMEEMCSRLLAYGISEDFRLELVEE